jgi:claudin
VEILWITPNTTVVITRLLLLSAGYVQACRGLMVAAVCLGFFGSVFVLVGMKCTTIGGTDKSKARLACVGGVNFIVSGEHTRG